jgi:hypothetical protein
MAAQLPIVKREQIVVDNAIPTEVSFAITSPAKIAGTGSFDLLAWNGVSFAALETVIIPSFIASAGDYAVTAGGDVTITVTPVGRS